MSEKLVGRSVRRKEDRRLLTGVGQYVADLRLEDAVEAVFIRSSFAHARIRRVVTDAARSMDGVIAVLTADDVVGKIKPFTRFVDQEHTPPQLERDVAPLVRDCPMEVLASRRVRYVGQPLAVVVAESRYIAEDAAEAIEIDYEPLESVVDVRKARDSGAPLIHDQVKENVQASYTVRVGDVDNAFVEADLTFSLEVSTPRVAANPIETRGLVAKHDDRSGELTVWMSTQTPYMVRTRLAEMLDVAEQSVRVVAPEVGGGFGPKANVYPEDIVVPYLSMVLSRPIRWIEDRREHLISTAHSRDQVHDVDVACNHDGRILGIRDHFFVDCGAYNPFSLTVAYNTGAHLRGPYSIPNFEVRGECVLTNKMPNVPYRGAGRPEAVYTMDRVIDEVACRLHIDPASVRFRNLIRPEQMPYDQGMLYRDGSRIIYESADYPAALREAMDLVGYGDIRTQQAEEGNERRVGVGLSLYVEGTGLGPFEGAFVRIYDSGHIAAHVGSCPHGQSHETTLSQICADSLGVSMEDITLKAGDTALLSHGGGTFASRTAVTAGTALLRASERLREKVLAVASELLETAVEDLDIGDGIVYPAGAPTYGVTLAEVAQAAAPGPRSRVPAGMDYGLESSYYFVPPGVTFAYGAHAAVVEVDPDLGSVDIVKFAVVHDSGKILNPMVVEGQIHGGVAQGVGTALYEEVVYDDEGQPLATTFMDYLLPTSLEVPEVVQVHHEFLTEKNPLGIKGVGEGGAISPPAAIAGAISDALRPLDLQLKALPLSPARVWTSIREAGTTVTGEGT